MNRFVQIVIIVPSNPLPPERLPVNYLIAFRWQWVVRMCEPLKTIYVSKNHVPYVQCAGVLSMWTHCKYWRQWKNQGNPHPHFRGKRGLEAIDSRGASWYARQSAIATQMSKCSVPILRCYSLHNSTTLSMSFLTNTVGGCPAQVSGYWKIT